MKQKVLLIGSEGSMGKRYQAILNQLKVPFGRVDTGRNVSDFDSWDTYTHFLVASPTDTHYQIIKDIEKFKKPILCEKPITKNLDELRELLDLCQERLSIVFQYLSLINFNSNVDSQSKMSWYNYFRTGNDGLYWDCMQIIALHRNGMGSLEIANVSPVWSCCINGKPLSINGMDSAYVAYLHTWLAGFRYIKHDKIFELHQKVVDFMKYKGVK